MKKLVLVMMFAALLACNTDKGPKSVSGLVLDATMNTMTVLSNQDTLYFSTIDAQKQAAYGILNGDLVEVFYTDALNSTGIGTICAATKVIVTQNPIVGRWVEPIPGIDGVQGIQINAGGVAASINMSTLVYTGWNMNGDKIELTGTSIGNGQTIEFTTTYNIDKLTADSLVISKDGFVVSRYSKEKE